MRINPDNQWPEIPENTAKREERRQKACALRTFYRAKFLSPAVSRLEGEEKVVGPGCLSIQIDTFSAVPFTVSAINRTGPVGENLSWDKIRTSRDKIMRPDYSMRNGRDNSALCGDRNRRVHDSRRVEEGQNA